MTPLNGIRVIDVTEGAQGPYAASLIGDLGAEVIKIERPGGEMMRRSGPFGGGLALPCLSICRGRIASVTLDLKSPGDMAKLKSLIAGADVFIQNWKIGTDARLGLDFNGVKALNPRIVYIRSSGFGPVGPFAEEGSMDMLSQTVAGMAAMSGDPAGGGERTRTPILDFISAFSASEAAMIGIHERDRTGEAVLVDSAQLSCALDTLGPEVALSNHAPVRPSGRTSRHYVFGEMCETADGDWVAVECVIEAHEQALAKLAGGLDQAVAWIKQQNTAGALAALAAAGIPAAKVERKLSVENVEARPGNLLRYNDVIAGEIRYPDVPWIFSATPVRAGVPLGGPGRDDAMLPAIIERWGGPPANKLAAE